MEIKLIFKSLIAKKSHIYLKRENLRMWQLKVSDSKNSYKHEKMKNLDGKNHKKATKLIQSQNEIDKELSRSSFSRSLHQEMIRKHMSNQAFGRMQLSITFSFEKKILLACNDSEK